MKTLTLNLAALLLAAGLAAAPKAKLPTGSFSLDLAHSRIGFEVVHLVVATVDGRFTQATATLDLNADPAKSKITAEIDVASVNTGIEKRDKHLRSGDFFDVEKHPKMTFVSRKVGLKGDKLTVEGDLTMKGVTKPVTLEGRYRGAVLDGYGNEKVGASLRGSLNRKDFGVNWGPMIEAGPVVSDTVDLILNIEAGRPVEAKTK